MDPGISTVQLSRAWGYVPPDVFSARWSGYLFVNRAGVYTFALTSDDGSNLYLDGRLVVENGRLQTLDLEPVLKRHRLLAARMVGTRALY